ncbi:hypothetical protein [Acinetobacter sp. YH12071]|uniref:hypothetical protein n=1 Tax=Acinetobacter sp. YH12071 TaxID=2601067 RepID=UPI0015D3F036|nr:hypothetical protein [Acinetobacter sp. YH12071]
MKRLLTLILIISTLLPSTVNAQDFYGIEHDNFIEKLKTYKTKHSANAKIIMSYSGRERTTAEDSLYYLTICNTVTNLKSAETLIINSPEYQLDYIKNEVLPSIRQNLDLYTQMAAMLNGTDFECK